MGSLVQAHPEALVSGETLGRLDTFQWKCIFSVDTKIRNVVEVVRPFQSRSTPLRYVPLLSSYA